MDIKHIEETIQDTIYKSFPMTKVECSYKGALRLLLIRVRYFCYGYGEELSIKYIDIEITEILTRDFLNNLMYEIGNKIVEKEAEYAAKR